MSITQRLFKRDILMHVFLNVLRKPASII